LNVVRCCGNNIFQSLVGRGRHCGTNWPTEIVEIATLSEIDEKLIDSSLPLVIHIWVTLSDFFIHISS
jgi:hypothetical protein